jgi:hypothetical protein
VGIQSLVPLNRYSLDPDTAAMGEIVRRRVSRDGRRWWCLTCKDRGLRKKAFKIRSNFTPGLVLSTWGHKRNKTHRDDTFPSDWLR